MKPDFFLRYARHYGANYIYNPALNALGLCTELGEFAEKPSVDEAGDVLFHVALLCDTTRLIVWSGLCVTLDHYVSTASSTAPTLASVLCKLDHVKKLLAGSPYANPVRAAEGLRDAAVFVLMNFDLEQAMRRGIAKRARLAGGIHSPEIETLLAEVEPSNPLVVMLTPVR